jgi:hypothetical protein
MGRPKHKTTLELTERIDAGELKSAYEWADELFGEVTIKSVGKVTSAIGRLRKEGRMFFAIDKGGPIEDVSDSATKFNHVVNRYVNNVEPQLVRSFEYAEKLITEHPKLREDVLMRAKSLIQIASNANKSLLGISYDGAANRPRKDQKGS